MEKKSQIIFTTDGNIKNEDVVLLKENGVIVIQVRDLSSLKTVNEIDNDIVLKCALETINEDGSPSLSAAKTRFFNKFLTNYIKKDGE